VKREPRTEAASSPTGQKGLAVCRKTELSEGGRKLSIVKGKGWGRRPVKLGIESVGAIDPGLLLFAVFVVRGLAEHAASAAGGGAEAAAIGG
jgi:hypothetical protein